MRAHARAYCSRNFVPAGHVITGYTLRYRAVRRGAELPAEAAIPSPWPYTELARERPNAVPIKPLDYRAGHRSVWLAEHSSGMPANAAAERQLSERVRQRSSDRLRGRHETRTVTFGAQP